MLKPATMLAALVLFPGAQVHADEARTGADHARQETTAKRMIADEADEALEQGSARPPAAVVEARAFARLDANADGMLQRQEVKDTDLDHQAFADADANGDGVLSLKEYGTMTTVLGHEAGTAGN